MFVLILTYIKPLEEIERLTPAHREYLQRHYDNGQFIVSGPQVPRTGGLIIAKVPGGRPEVESIIAEDPFLTEGVATYQIIEFTARAVGKGYEALQG